MTSSVKPSVIRSIKKMQSLSRRLTSEGKMIALVPTMGFLHEGHLSLIRKGLKLADVVITTIFVNPTQFAPHEDLEKYPRDEKGDIKKIGSAGGRYVFIPKSSDIYPNNFQTYVHTEKLTQILEGASRPTHFRGVTTIVAKLFNITRPDFALFGMKDFQQATVLSQMTRDLDYPIKIVIGPTVREKDGLAMSSRNKYFSPNQRSEAVCLYQALKTARRMVVEGQKSATKIERRMRRVISTTCPTAEVDYISFNRLGTLEPVRQVARSTVCSLAVRVHGVRLIDNLKLA